MLVISTTGSCLHLSNLPFCCRTPQTTLLRSALPNNFTHINNEPSKGEALAGPCEGKAWMGAKLIGGSSSPIKLPFQDLQTGFLYRLQSIRAVNPRAVKALLV